MNIEEYERAGHHRYAEFAETVASILKAAIVAHGGMRPQDIQRRAKDAESLRRKLVRDGRECSDAIEDDVKDLAGARLVFYTNNDVHRFGQAAILSDNFDVNYERSKIHYPSGTGEDEPFLISENWVVRLKVERTALPEYAPYAGMKCEIQIQTVLDHAWAEMAHDTVYKPMNEAGFGGAAIEDMRRRLQEVMRTHLLPAGYEFQKIASDFEQLKAGKSKACLISGPRTTCSIAPAVRRVQQAYRCGTLRSVAVASLVELLGARSESQQHPPPHAP